MKRTPMKRGTKPLERKTELPRAKKPMRQKRATPRRQTRDTAIAEESGENDWSPEVRREVRLRSGGMCELKCNRIATSMHHRKLRAHGDHRAINALHLDSRCHEWIHAHPFESYENGWLVRSTLDPADVPVELPEIPVGA